MSKFNLFVIFFSITLLLVVTDVLTNGYLKGLNNRKDLPASVYGDDISPENGKVTESVTPPSVMATSQSSDEDTANDVETENKNPLSFSLLLQVGFSNVILAKIPFQGVVFESIDLRDLKNVEVSVHNVLDQNRRRISTFYEFQTEDSSIANELYSLILQKSYSIPNASINQTNAFGTASFYINYHENSPFTFLVVNQGRNVYALTYRKDLHPFVKKLITFLP